MPVSARRFVSDHPPTCLISYIFHISSMYPNERVKLYLPWILAIPCKVLCLNVLLQLDHWMHGSIIPTQSEMHLPAYIKNMVYIYNMVTLHKVYLQCVLGIWVVMKAHMQCMYRESVSEYTKLLLQ